MLRRMAAGQDLVTASTAAPRPPDAERVRALAEVYLREPRRMDEIMERLGYRDGVAPESETP
jgi:hypothetical protein